MKARLGTPSLLTAIDIGTTKICVLIAQQVDDEHVEIVGIGKSPSTGLAHGVVVDIAPAVHAIKSALKEAEMMAGYQVESALIGISGGHISSSNSQGMVPIKHGEIKQSDITNVINTAKAVPLPEGQQLLHALPQFFTIDNQHLVRDPLGMFGVRLEAQVHLITGAVASVQNLVRCCAMAGVKAQDIILEPLASASAVLSDDELELGVGMLDIGGGTSDFAIYQRGNIRHTQVFLIAGNVFTNDIAVCLHTTLKEAERIKKDCVITDRSDEVESDILDIATMHGEGKQAVSRSILQAVLESRAEELLMIVRKEIDRQKLRSFMPAGLVITGGGSLLYGLQEQAARILEMPVRIGKPRVPVAFKQSLDNPMYATGYGLLAYKLRSNKQALLHGEGPLLSQIFSHMKTWVFDFF